MFNVQWRKKALKNSRVLLESDGFMSLFTRIIFNCYNVSGTLTALHIWVWGLANSILSPAAGPFAFSFSCLLLLHPLDHLLDLLLVLPVLSPHGDDVLQVLLMTGNGPGPGPGPRPPPPQHWGEERWWRSAGTEHTQRVDYYIWRLGTCLKRILKRSVSSLLDSIKIKTHTTYNNGTLLSQIMSRIIKFI